MSKGLSTKTLLYRTSISPNLYGAWNELNKLNKESRGLSEETIQSFGDSLRSNISGIRKQLRDGVYEFSEVRGKILSERKPSGKIKSRPIRIPEIKDRLVQRAIARRIELPLHRKYILRNKVSFAYLKKSGIRDALSRMLEFYMKGFNVCFETDIISFFDNVNKLKLLKKITFALPDDTINSLIEDSLYQKVGNITDFSSDDQELFSNNGIPQGGALSPLFANVYLSGFDAEMIRNGFNLIRYADDFIVMCKTFDEAHRAHEFSKNFLNRSLGLEIHVLSDNEKSKTNIIKIGQKPLSFLGSTFTGRYIFPYEESIKKLNMNIRNITKYDESKTLLMVLDKLKKVLEGWISSFCHTELNQCLPYIEKRLRKDLFNFTKKIKWSPHGYRISKEQCVKAGLPNLISLINERKDKLLKRVEFRIFHNYWKT